jgi:hypothetical protein
MSFRPIYCAIVGMALASITPSAPAQAQAVRTWVSGVGDDANPCSRTAPCKTFAGAISKTAASGEINCLDPGGFGTVTIIKSITLDCTATLGSILASFTNAVIINDGGSGSIIVRLRGLTIQGAGTGLIGVDAISLRALFIDNCIIANFNGGTAIGVRFVPAAPALLFINNTVIDHNGIAPGAGGGVQIAGSGGFSLTNVSLTNNVTGVALTGSAAGEIRESLVAASNANAILAGGGTLLLNHSSVVNNVQAGILASGATVSIGDSTITGNSPGVTGSTLLSFKNNQIAGNFPDGTPINAVPGYSGTGQ